MSIQTNSQQTPADNGFEFLDRFGSVKTANFKSACTANDQRREVAGGQSIGITNSFGSGSKCQTKNRCFCHLGQNSYVFVNTFVGLEGKNFKFSAIWSTFGKLGDFSQRAVMASAIGFSSGGERSTAGAGTEVKRAENLAVTDGTRRSIHVFGRPTR